MTTHSEALKAKARKAADDRVFRGHCAVDFYDGYLRATSDALAVIEAEMGNRCVPSSTTSDILTSVMSKIRNPEPELPEAVSDAARELRALAALARIAVSRTPPEWPEKGADALESAARERGWG